MNKKIAIFAIGLAAIASLPSCNSSDDPVEQISYTSTLVSAFSLKDNSKVLNNLDSVFFTIDLAAARIFNADSLPFGTDVSRLQVDITTDACSTVELYYPRENQADSCVNYLKSSTDSIDFSRGMVRLHVASYDAKAFRDYLISVNVHTVKPDSLYWNKLAMSKLPRVSGTPRAQKTVKKGDMAYCFVDCGMAPVYSLSSSDQPSERQWSTKSISLPFTPDVNSFAATDDKFFMLSTDGELFASADDGESWTSTGQTWCHVYGSHGSRLLGLSRQGAAYYQVTYPATEAVAAPSDFPVAATSTLATLTSKWTSETQEIMVGGKLADGSLTNATWGYDGKTWGKVSTSFPVKTAAPALFDYKVADVDTVSWRVVERQVLLCLGGSTPDGLTKKVYISRDLGVNWKEGDQLIQLPEYIPAMTNSQPIVLDATYPVSRSVGGQWQSRPSRKLPVWARVFAPGLSRAVAPIEQWVCPVIYLFGGTNEASTLYDTIWKGVINRLTFKPLQ